MKLSKSIVIFLFALSISGAFSYALNRTDGNVYKSVLFTMYFLAIKIGLIPPNVPLYLNQSQPNQQLVSRVQPRPVYNPYVSILDEYRPFGLYMTNFERSSLVSQHSQSLKLVNELRAGNSRVTQAAWLLITIWLLQQQSTGFQPINLVPRPPHLQGLYGNQQSGNQFGYAKGAGPRSIKVVGATQNAGSDKKQPSSLTKEQRRNLPDPRDEFICEEGHPHLVGIYGQVLFKTPDHGKVHGLPVDEKGRTPKTEKNALALRDSIVNPKRKNIVWFDNGMYQGGTNHGYDSVNIFDKDTNTITVFRKGENGEYNRFTSTCTVTNTERVYLFESGGNFVTDNNLNNPGVFPILKNLTNKETEK